MSTQINSKTKVKGSTVIAGFLLILIPIIMGVLICIPTFGQWVIASKAQIFKGLIVGISLLPILLFIAIKGGGAWYKRWWTWGIILVSMVALVIIVVMSKPAVPGDDMGVPPIENMMDQGTSVGAG